LLTPCHPASKGSDGKAAAPAPDIAESRIRAPSRRFDAPMMKSPQRNAAGAIFA
jgi:hypothetical protein